MTRSTQQSYILGNIFKVQVIGDTPCSMCFFRVLRPGQGHLFGWLSCIVHGEPSTGM